MVLGTITDEKGTKTWEVRCSADVDAMIQTKHNEQVKVEFRMDLTKMIKFECGDKDECMCNVFSVKTGRNKTVKFLWNKKKKHKKGKCKKQKRNNTPEKENDKSLLDGTVCGTPLDPLEVAADNAANAGADKTISVKTEKKQREQILTKEENKWCKKRKGNDTPEDKKGKKKGNHKSPLGGTVATPLWTFWKLLLPKLQILLLSKQTTQLQKTSPSFPRPAVPQLWDTGPFLDSWSPLPHARREQSGNNKNDTGTNIFNIWGE